jgi:hypothetical protein|tara:strand:+ start:410 stop:742 length:333 start_codon:yes stop_codon:yes gene_type:complete
MDPIDLPKNTLAIAFQIDMEEGELSVMTQHNLEQDEMDDVEYQIQVDLLLGLQMMLDAAPELLIRQGLLQRLLTEGKEDDGPEIVFEPDEELLDILAEGKIIPFKKTRIH